MLEELDSEREWYYDYRQGKLYFAFNGTAPTTEEWIATRTKVLFNVSGTASAPAKDISKKRIFSICALFVSLTPKVHHSSDQGRADPRHCADVA